MLSGGVTILSLVINLINSNPKQPLKMLWDSLLYSGPNHHSMEKAVWLNPFWLWSFHGSLGRSPVVQWDGILVQCPREWEGWLVRTGRPGAGTDLLKAFSKWTISTWEMMPGQKNIRGKWDCKKEKMHKPTDCKQIIQPGIFLTVSWSQAKINCFLPNPPSIVLFNL